MTRNNPVTPSPFQAWLHADESAGPQQSFRLACKLSEQMRALGRTATARADWAMARTQFWMGRFEASRALLAASCLDAIAPEADSACRLELLIPLQHSWALAMLGEPERAREQAEHGLNWARTQSTPSHLALAAGYLAQLECLLDAPEATLHWCRQARATTGSSQSADSAILLEYWALSRLGRATDEGRAQTALCDLRRCCPSHEARAFSLYAQARFHQSAAHALTHLNAALDLNARFSLHHWTARLMWMKSQSLDASGQLGEANRFLQLAAEIAQRQGARLFLDDIAGIESRTHASPHLESAT